MSAQLLGRREEAISDELLVEQICKGHPELFDLLYDRFFSRVYRFVDRRLPSREDTEETVQEVFFSVFSSLTSYRGDAPFGAWVFGLTRHTLASRFKRKRAETVPLAEEDDAAAPWSREADPHQAYELTERLGRMQQAIQKDLSPEQWQLFRLHHLENQSIQEIAGGLAKSEDAIKSHLYRARKLLLAR